MRINHLWDVVAAQGAVSGASRRELVWYLAITEWIVLSLPLVHLTIEQDVKTGDIAYRLPRPISYLGFRLAESAGDEPLAKLAPGDRLRVSVTRFAPQPEHVVVSRFASEAEALSGYKAEADRHEAPLPAPVFDVLVPRRP